MLEIIEPGEVVTPPKPIVTPDPEQSTEDDTLYTDHPIYLGKGDLPSNYEEGNAEDYQKWLNKEQGE